MSYTAVDNAFVRETSRQLSATAFRLYVVLLSHQGAGEYAFPAITLLCDEMGGIRRDTVLEAIRSLEDATLVRVERGGGRGNPSRYYVKVTNGTGNQKGYGKKDPLKRTLSAVNSTDKGTLYPYEIDEKRVRFGAVNGPVHHRRARGEVLHEEDTEEIKTRGRAEEPEEDTPEEETQALRAEEDSESFSEGVQEEDTTASPEETQSPVVNVHPYPPGSGSTYSVPLDRYTDVACHGCKGPLSVADSIWIVKHEWRKGADAKRLPCCCDVCAEQVEQRLRRAAR